MWTTKLLSAALALVLAAGVQAYHVQPQPHSHSHLNYTVVTGIFKQDDPATDASTFNFTAENFGLIERGYPSDGSCVGAAGRPTSWERLAHYIETLNRQAKWGERYTLMFLGRHGEGYHNAAESYYGTPAWNCYYSELDGNGTVTWADAHLTPTGIQQALTAHTFWTHLLTTHHAPAPQSYYTSPLTRALSTALLTFTALPLPHSHPFVPTIKELFREGISAHTCDRRSTRSAIARAFPGFRFEAGFSEEDPFWRALRAEPAADQDVRSKTVLDDVFWSDRSTYVSVTAHSGEIASLLRVLGHRAFGLSTGAVIPVLVRATMLVGEAPATGTVPWGSQRTCAVPPTIKDASCNDCSCCS